MSKIDFQKFLNRHGADIAEDGAIGPATLAAMDSVFSNKDAPAADDADLFSFANRIGCEIAHIKAIRKVETNGGGFDNAGRPRILYERHYFHRLTEGEFTGSHPGISWPRWGGYGASSAQWGRLQQAARLDPEAAFRSCSWGLFQIMGDHCDALGYPDAYSMPFNMTQSEADHYEALARFISVNHLDDELRAGGRTAGSWQAFARKYNGPAYAQNRYDQKLAAAYVEFIE